MRLGFHISIAGGFKNVAARALERGCKTIQLFSRNPRGWEYKPLDKTEIEIFKQQIKAHAISPIFVHMPYLPNLASTQSSLFELSVASLIADLKRSEEIGAQFLIMHVGSAREKKAGIRQMVAGINKALSEICNKVMLLLENTAGSGNELGYQFDQIKEIILKIKHSERVGVVLDTAHAFEAGYDLRTEKTVDDTLRNFNSIIGFDKLYLIHFNDSKTKLGSRSDRHWHIAKGQIGAGMAYILNHPALKNLPFIMETPRTDTKEDMMNMRVAKSLVSPYS